MPSPKPSRFWHAPSWSGYASVAADDASDYAPDGLRTSGWSVSFGNRRKSQAAQAAQAAPRAPRVVVKKPSAPLYHNRPGNRGRVKRARQKVVEVA